MSEAMYEKKRKQRVQWNDHEIRMLLNYWKEHIMELRKTKRNLKVFGKISSKLQRDGVNKTAQEVEIKISNLSKKFRQQKRIFGSSGGGPAKWIYFDSINRIIGRFPCKVNSLVQETCIDFCSESASLNPPLSRKKNVEAAAYTPKEVTETPFLVEDNDFNITPKLERDDEIFERIERSLTTTYEESTPLTSNGFTTPASTCFNSSGSDRRSRRKRSNSNLQEELLEEIKRSNRIVDEELKKANEIAQESVNIQKQMLEFFKSLYN